MATTQSQSFRGGSISPGSGVNEDDLKSLVITRTTAGGVPQQEIYDPLTGKVLGLGRVTIKSGNHVIGSYDPLDANKTLDISGYGAEVVNGDYSIDVTKTSDPDTGDEVFTIKVPNGGVHTEKLADESVTNPKLADGAVNMRTIDQSIVRGLDDGLNTTIRTEDYTIHVDSHDNTIEALAGETIEPLSATDTLTIERGKYYYIQSDHDVAIDLNTDESETTVHTNLVLVAEDNCVNFDIVFEAVGSYQTARMYVTVNPGNVVVLYCQIRKLETLPNVFKYPARVWQSNEVY